MQSTLLMNPIMQNKELLVAAYLMPKFGNYLKMRQPSVANPTVLDYGTCFFQHVESKGIEYLGVKKWRYFVNVYGENLWIAMAGVILLSHRHESRQMDHEGLSLLLRTYLLAFTVFPPIIYGMRLSLHKFLPHIAQHLADFIKP